MGADEAPHLLTDVADGVAVATLNRPDKLNAMSAQMVQGLAEALERWEYDDEVGAVVVTGSGRGFCAGGDVAAFAARGGEAGGAVESPSERVASQVASQRRTVGRLHGYSKPTIAALPGVAAGAGLGLALACDLRVASERASLVTAFAKVGLSGDYGVVWLLSRIGGVGLARRSLLLGDRISAADALRAGLVDRIDADPLAAARSLAASLADGPRLALAHLKSNLLDAERLTLDEAMEREVVRHQECGATADHREAALAFVEKRDPVFRR